MCVFGRAALILLLTVHRVTAMPHEMMSWMMPDRNYSMQGFPPLPVGFREGAQRLMTKCYRMGYPLPGVMDTNQTSSIGETNEDVPSNPFFMFPTLLASLPSLPWLSPPPPLILQNDTEGPPIGQINWTISVSSSGLQNVSLALSSPENISLSLPGPKHIPITEKVMNCSDLLHMIEVMKNSKDDGLCFVRAFVAPLSWDILVRNGTDLAFYDFALLLWGAEPFLLNTPPPVLTLPWQLPPPQLTKMMGLLNKMFDSLSLDQKSQILHWAKQQVAHNHLNCTLGPLTSPKANGSQNLCPPRMGWMKADVMETIGRFLTLLPASEFRTVPKEELCAFFLSPRLPCSFCGLGRVPPSLGRLLFHRVKDHCVHGNHAFLHRLGSLACFYGDTSSLSASLSKVLLSQLSECDNSESIKLRKELVGRVISTEGDSLPSLMQLLELGASAVSALSLSQLAQLPSTALWDKLPSLRRVEWQPVQARTLVRTLLGGEQVVSGKELLGLGSLVRGVSSSVLLGVGPQGILGADGLDALSQELSALQRMALLKGLCRNVSMIELVRSVSSPLLSSLPLSALERAGLRSLDQLEGRSWTKAQSVFLVREILGNKLQLKDIGRLGSALQGVTCEMIKNINQTDLLAMVQELAQRASQLSRAQVKCAAERLFESLERERRGYFYNVTNAELSAIPALMLLYLPLESIEGLSESACPSFLEKMSQADLSFLPQKSFARMPLISKAMSCLGKNLSSLAPNDITRLGNLVCEMGSWYLSGMAPSAINASLLAQSQCQRIDPHHSRGLFKHVTALYGEPSNWSMNTMESLGPFLLLNDSVLMSLPYKPWLKAALSDLLDSLPPAPSPPPPEEFRNLPDLSALHHKLFSLATDSTPTSATVHNRMEDCIHGGPTLLQVVELGERNVLWSPAHLAEMSAETFREGVSMLGSIHGFSHLQLQALRNKTIQVWGAVGFLSEEQLLQLGCVTQGFSPAELQELNITSLDVLELLSSCGWRHDQSEAILRGYMRRANLTMEKLGAVEVVGLGQIICGMSPQEADQLNTDTYREALGTLGSVHCTQNVTERLKEKALHVFGEVANWTEAQVNTLGNIMAVLNASELQSLNPAVFTFIRQSAIPLIPPDRLAALSISQLMAMGPDNAAMVTTTQFNALTPDQQNALGEALGVKFVRSMTPTLRSPEPIPLNAGASRLSIMGTVVFWQHLLLLLLRYIQ